MTTVIPTERADVDVDRIPLLIDVDAHVVEPPNVWSDRLPKRYREVGPRVEHRPAATIAPGTFKEMPGTEGSPVAWWVYEDYWYATKRVNSAAGYPAEEVTTKAVTFDDMRPGCWKTSDRLLDMNQNGVEAQLCYPTFCRFAGQIFLNATDKDLALLCVRAYNDWTIEEWAGPSGGRLIPLCLVPLWDPVAAADEVRRNAARGVHAVAFSEIPPYLGLPSIYSGHWDPFFEACEETRTVPCMHIGSGTKIPHTSDDAPFAVDDVLMFANSAGGMLDWMFSGALHRFPELKVLFAECQIGWVPYLLDRADDVWETHRGWSNSQRSCPDLPSSYYYRSIYSCFFKDPIGVRLLDRAGVDNVCFETDYPHQDSTWPRSREAAAEQFGFLDDETIRKLARGNAIRLFSLPFEP